MLKIIIASSNSSTTDEIANALKSCISDINISVINIDEKLPYSLNHSYYPDALIFDIQFCDIEAVKLIKQLREYSDMPIIVVSTNNDIRLLVKYLDAGADDFILTPFNNKIFASSVQALIRRVNWGYQIN